MITLKHKNDIAILHLHGNIIGEAIPEIRDVITKQIDTTPTPRILIDFKGVHKMDSSGIGTLVNAHKQARAKNGRIGIIHVGRNIRNLIVRSRLINIFEHFNTEADAVSCLSRTFAQYRLPIQSIKQKRHIS